MSNLSLVEDLELEFSLMTTADAQYPSRSPIGSSHPGLALKNRKILIVADDRSKVRSLTDILRPQGYIVSDVNSGEAALTYYSEMVPDLIHAIAPLVR